MSYDDVILSFDIFDTLLVRSFMKPVDVFKYIEYCTKSFGFTSWRRKAENIAKLKYKREVTFDEIYEDAPIEFADLKEKELETERKILKPNYSIIGYFEEQKKNGKRIIATSDMYLPSNFLREVLESNGFMGIEKIYVSAEHNATKATGKLFKKIQEDFELDESHFIHIGDNKLSDYHVPKMMGWKVEKCINVTKRFMHKNRDYRHFYGNNKRSLAHSIITAVSSHKPPLNNYLETFGFQVVGPMALSYCAFIASRCRELNIDTLLCVSRDGYFLQKCFDTLAKDIKAKYVYVPRRQYYTTHYDVDFQSDYTVPNLICTYFNVDTSKPKRWIREHEKELKELLKNEREKLDYITYLKNEIGEANEIALVDGPSARRTAQKFIQKELDRDIVAFYVHLLPRLRYQNFKTISFLQFPKHYIINRIKRSYFIEQVFTSPEESTAFVNGKGEREFCVSGKKVPKRSEVYGAIENGVEAFFESIVPFTEELDIFKDNKVFEDMLVCFSRYRHNRFNAICDRLKMDKWLHSVPGIK